MHKFSIVDDGINLHLRARLASWAADEDQRAEHLGRYNVQVSEFTGALGRLLDALSTEARGRVENGRTQPNKLNADVIRSFQDMTYRLAEVYDFLGRLPNDFNAKSTKKSAVGEYKGVIRKARRTACLICNKIKHNDHFLGRADNFYDSGIYVEGFVLYSRGRNASLKIASELHNAKRPGMSFNLEIRSLAFDFLRADVAAGRLCSALGAGETEQPDANLLNSLRHLIQRPEVGLRYENAGSFPTMREHSGSLILEKIPRKLPFLGNNVRVIQQSFGDGYTRTFPFAG